MNIMVSLVDLNQRKCGGENNNKTKTNKKETTTKNKTEEKKIPLFSRKSDWVHQSLRKPDPMFVRTT